MKGRINTLDRDMYCPVCGRGKLLAVGDSREAGQIRLLPPQEAEQAAYFLKCMSCKSQVGVAINVPLPPQYIPVLGTVAV